jgi:hypothetical protein
VETLLRLEFYRNYIRKYDYVIKADDDILIRTKNWDRVLIDRMSSLGPSCVSLGAIAITSSNLALMNHSKFVIYRSDYILQADKIELRPVFMHPLVCCEVLSNIVSKSDRSPIGRVLIGGPT